MSNKKIIFNTSMPRSGSELLQVLLHQNPKIYGSPTSPLLEYMFGARQNFELSEVKSQNPELMQKAFLNMNKEMTQAYYAPITDRPIISDKNRGWSHYFEWVEQWNEEPKMICMVRDLRSIIASFERIYRANRHSPQGIDNPAELQNMTVGQRVYHWLNTQPVGLALQRTADLFERGVDDKILFVRYEDLCESPQRELNRIYNYIGEEPFRHDFQNIVKQVEEDDGFYGIFGQHGVKRSIQPAPEKDWEEILPDDVSDDIKKNVEWYFREFNYYKK